jgi:U3 small nucleolar RNA-associated protein 14
VEQPSKPVQDREPATAAEQVVLKIVKNPFYMDDTVSSFRGSNKRSPHNSASESTLSSTSRIATDQEPSATRDSRIPSSSTKQRTATTSTSESTDNIWLAPAIKQSKKRPSENHIDKIQSKRKRQDLDPATEKVNIDTSIDRINATLAATLEVPEDEDAPSMTYGRGKIAFQQNELLQKAFAADAFEQEFLEGKQAAIAEDAPKEEDLTLPGWGAWVGKGVKRRATEKKLVKQVPGIDESKRKDAKLKHVIINEKRVKPVFPYSLELN